MKKISLLDRYPVYVVELPKTETDVESTDQVIARLRAQVEAPNQVMAGWIAALRKQ